MKKALLAVLIILVFCSAGMAAIKDSPDGFRGIKWGQPPSALGQCKLLANTEEGFSLYVKNDDKLKVGDADLAGIMYFFWENKFMMAILATEGFGNSKSLKAAMIARYGEPQFEQDGTNDFCSWYDDKIMITYGYLTDESKAVATITNKPLLNKKTERDKAAAQKGAKDF